VGVIDRADADTGTEADADRPRLDRNLAAALAYLLGAASGAAVLVFVRDEFVRFHARQSVGASAALFGLYLAVGIACALLAMAPVVGPAFAAAVRGLPAAFGLAALGLWGLLTYHAYRGRRFSLPVVGTLVAR
jgi:uncharacterized membrane protein